MHSLLRRWLHKYHRLTHLDFHSSVSKDTRERLEPIGTPNKYVCEDLAGEYAKYWAKIREDNGEGLEEIQRNAMNCWHAFWFDFGERTEQPSLPLDFCVKVFNDYFFLGSLRPYTNVKLADESPADWTWVGLITSKRQCMLSGPPEIHIELKRLPIQVWTCEVLRRQSLYSSAYIDSQERTHTCTTFLFYSVKSAPHSLPANFRLQISQ